nr:hypothetical protein [Tanacetum cinerariifolium]
AVRVAGLEVEKALLTQKGQCKVVDKQPDSALLTLVVLQQGPKLHYVLTAQQEEAIAAFPAAFSPAAQPARAPIRPARPGRSPYSTPAPSARPGTPSLPILSPIRLRSRHLQ